MFASFMAALKALPAIRDIFQDIQHSLSVIADKRTDAKIAKILAEVRVATERFQQTEDRDEMLKAIKDLSNATSR